MGEETASENGRICDFQGLVTLTLTLERVVLHTVMHHSSTSTYTPNFIEIEKTLCGRTDGRTDRHLRPTLLGRLEEVDLINYCSVSVHTHIYILTAWWLTSFCICGVNEAPTVGIFFQSNNANSKVFFSRRTVSVTDSGWYRLYSSYTYNYRNNASDAHWLADDKQYFAISRYKWKTNSSKAPTAMLKIVLHSILHCSIVNRDVIWSQCR